MMFDALKTLFGWFVAQYTCMCVFLYTICYATYVIITCQPSKKEQYALQNSTWIREECTKYQIEDSKSKQR